MKSLEQVLAHYRDEAICLRSHGHRDQATSLEKMRADVEAATVDYLTWLPEDEAVLRTGWSARRLRAQFPEWEAQRMAELRGRIRYYRQPILPLRPNLEAARADAERRARAS